MNLHIDCTKYPEYKKGYKTHLNELKPDESVNFSNSGMKILN